MPERSAEQVALVACIGAARSLDVITSAIDQYQRDGLLVPVGTREMMPVTVDNADEGIQLLEELNEAFDQAKVRILEARLDDPKPLLMVLYQPHLVVTSALNVVRHWSVFGLEDTLAELLKTFDQLTDHLHPLSRVASDLGATFQIRAHQQRTATLEGDATAGANKKKARVRAPSQATQRAIRRALSGAGEPLQWKAIKTALRLPRAGNLRAHLAWMCQQEQLVHTKNGYTLPDKPPEEAQQKAG